MIEADRIAERLLRDDRTLLDDAMRQGTRYLPTRAGTLVEIEGKVSRRVAEDAVLAAYARIMDGRPPFG